MANYWNQTLFYSSSPNNGANDNNLNQRHQVQAVSNYVAASNGMRNSDYHQFQYGALPPYTSEPAVTSSHTAHTNYFHQQSGAATGVGSFHPPSYSLSTLPNYDSKYAHFPLPNHIQHLQTASFYGARYKPFSEQAVGGRGRGRRAPRNYPAPNLDMSQDLIVGFIRRISILLDESTIIPLEIIQICEQYSLSDLNILPNQTKILCSNRVYIYNKIIIHKNGTLTTTNWNGTKGGKLLIKCEYIEIKSNGKIAVNGKGYRGGQNGGYQGESYHGTGQIERSANDGGGGGGYREASGGGYGSKGRGVGGGNIYGNHELSALYLGSGGGGGGFSGNGGNGGGIIHIISDRILIERNGYIQSNGDDGGIASGGGSGGSIYVQCKEIINNGCIEAKGGKGGYVGYGGYGGYAGFGGYGRIRIECSNFKNTGKIVPMFSHTK